eukprot:326825_1
MVIGLKNNDMNITAKSLFISDIPLYTFSDNLSLGQCTNTPTSMSTLAPTLSPTESPEEGLVQPTHIPTSNPAYIPTDVLITYETNGITDYTITSKANINLDQEKIELIVKDSLGI